MDVPLAELVAQATKMCQSESGSYNQASGAAYDYFMQILFYPIAFSLELGYRVVPRSNSFEYLVISVMEFFVTDTAPKIPSSPIIIVHVPNQEPLSEKGEDNGEAMFMRRFHKSYFFPIKVAEKTFDVTLELFSPGEEKKVLLKANLFVQLSLNHCCVHSHLPLFDEDQVEHGYINVDTRILPAEQLKIEIKQAMDWNENSQHNLAIRIEKVCEDFLALLCEN